MQDQDLHFMQHALDLAKHGITQRHGGPFGAIVVIGDKIVGQGWNQVVLNHDPTAHAEILAIRDACEHIEHFHLEGATLYTSCEPCPMCLSAAYWARIQTIVYAASTHDVAGIGFSDEEIRRELQKPMGAGKIMTRQLLRMESLEICQQWIDDGKKTRY